MAPYPLTRAKLENVILQNFPEAMPRENKSDTISPDHLLWMLNQLCYFKKPAKSGRWLGYVIGVLETREMLRNEEIRAIVKRDVKNGDE